MPELRAAIARLLDEEKAITHCRGPAVSARTPSPHEAETMSKAPKIDPQEQARILFEALPHMQRYDEETVVVKYGGHAMGQEQMARDFARDIVLLEQTAINPVVVHGGGPQIEAMLKKLGIKSEFAAGLRITDAKTVEIVEMVLAGSINKQLVGYINAAGGKAIGLCEQGCNMVQARKVSRTVVDPVFQHRKGRYSISVSWASRKKSTSTSSTRSWGANDTGAGAGRNVSQWRHVQCQRRYVWERHRGRAQSQAFALLLTCPCLDKSKVSSRSFRLPMRAS